MPTAKIRPLIHSTEIPEESASRPATRDPAADPIINEHLILAQEMLGLERPTGAAEPTPVEPGKGPRPSSVPRGPTTVQ